MISYSLHRRRNGKLLVDLHGRGDCTVSLQAAAHPFIRVGFGKDLEMTIPLETSLDLLEMLQTTLSIPLHNRQVLGRMRG